KSLARLTRKEAPSNGFGIRRRGNRQLCAAAEGRARQWRCTMQARIRRKLSMVDRVLMYDQEYPSTDPGYIGVMARLEQLSARGAELLAMEVDGDTGERLATQRRTEVRRNLSGMLRHLDRVGTAATALERPELKGKFDAPESNLTNRNFLATARQLLVAATEHQELLLKFSLGE